MKKKPKEVKRSIRRKKTTILKRAGEVKTPIPGKRATVAKETMAKKRVNHDQKPTSLNRVTGQK